MIIAFASYLSASIAFLLLTGLFLLAGSGSRLGRLLIFASLVSAIWAAAVAAAVYTANPAVGFLEIGLEFLRTAVWLLFIGTLVAQRLVWFGPQWRRGALLVIAALVVAGTVSDVVFVHGEASAGVTGAAQTAGTITHLALAVIGLVLVENIFRTATDAALWSLKYLVLGAGLLFGFDFFLYADALLLNRLDPDLFAARGAVNTLAVPLIAIAAGRNRDWSVDVHVSRQAVFHTTTVLAAGVYLILMAAAGYYLRQMGGQWGPLLQIVFLTAAGLVVLVALFSESLRARLRNIISHHFFSHRYDYRAEWLRFIDTLSAGTGSLHDRAIRAVADIVDSPAGALWVRHRDEDQFYPAAIWNYPEDLPHLAADSALVGHLENQRSVVALEDGGGSGGGAPDSALPAWLLELRRAWLVIPFIHRDTLQGFLLLAQSRAKRSLSWEDDLLLKTVGRQVASYLAEEAALQRLVDARNLEAFNARFAFVVHDIKNIVSQLSLMLRNADKHKDNPEFQDDLVATVGHSVEKMREMLGQLRLERERMTELAAPPGEDGDGRPIEVTRLIRETADAWRESGTGITLDLPAQAVEARGDEGRLVSILRHLIQNAVEAVADKGAVTLRAVPGDGRVLIEVIDDGPGMDPAFIKEHLFKPLHTTKPGGSGLGVYQARKLVNEMGGTLETISAPGAGTTMRIVLPAPVPQAKPEALQILGT